MYFFLPSEIVQELAKLEEAVQRTQADGIWWNPAHGWLKMLRCVEREVTLSTDRFHIFFSRFAYILYAEYLPFGSLKRLDFEAKGIVGPLTIRWPWRCTVSVSGQVALPGFVAGSERGSGGRRGAKKRTGQWEIHLDWTLASVPSASDFLNQSWSSTFEVPFWLRDREFC